MSTLEYTIYGIKRGWRISRTFVFCGAFAALLVNGFFTTTIDQNRIVMQIIFAVWAVVFGLKARTRFVGPPRSSATVSRIDLELGLLLILATMAGIQVAGGLDSPYYPALLILLAFIVVYTPQWVGFTLVGATIGLEFAIVAHLPTHGATQQALIHAIFIALFSLINLIFTRTEVTRMRHRALKRIEQVKMQMVNDAKAFRLTVATSEEGRAASRAEEEERLSRCTVSEVRRTMYHHINLLKQTMDLHTCILFWKNDDQKTVRVAECVSDTDQITDRPLGVREGIVGAALQSKKPLVQKDLRLGHSSLVYYNSPAPVTDLLALPVMEGHSVSGVLLADRIEHRHFSDDEKAIVEQAVESILQTLNNERVFVQLQKVKSEQGRLLKASASLSKSLKPREVVSAALDAVSMVAPYDMGAVAILQADGKLKVIEARGENEQALVDLSCGKGAGLAGSVIRTGHYLPYRGKFDPKQQVVFTKAVQPLFMKMQSLLMLPLTSGEDPLGLLMLAKKERSTFTEQIRTTLQVMTNQLGTKLQNAQMVQKLEELATTDGLTGLPNHRSFQEELTRQMAHAKRYGTPVSVILCDVDKFKNVNDTYGHTVGDVVLKALGATLRRNVVRDTDMPARYGGEEFVIICGGTDTRGAVQLGNRIREDLQSQLFKTEKGDMRCTISMGVATYPDHAHIKEDLIERADLALYAAKESGRNRVCTWDKSMKK